MIAKSFLLGVGARVATIIFLIQLGACVNGSLRAVQQIEENVSSNSEFNQSLFYNYLALSEVAHSEGMCGLSEDLAGRAAVASESDPHVLPLNPFNFDIKSGSIHELTIARQRVINILDHYGRDRLGVPGAELQTSYDCWLMSSVDIGGKKDCWPIGYRTDLEEFPELKSCKLSHEQFNRKIDNVIAGKL